MRAVVFALALAFVSGQSPVFAPDFAAGKTYVYKYEAFLLGGLPEEGLARAGLKITSKVMIRNDVQNTYMLKLAEPELFEYSGIWPNDAPIPATKLTEKLASELKNPIKFEYTNGVVGRIHAPEGISTLVLNIHRGILNILQLNIKKTHNVYDLQEIGTQGVCKTLYSITEDIKAERIHLTKTRDMNNCQEKIMKDIGLAYTEKCDKCQQDNKNLRGTSSFTYTLKEVASGVMILKANVIELIQFSPFSEHSGTAQMETKQSLVFLEIQKEPLSSTNAEYHHRGSLKFEFSTELLQSPLQLIKITDLRVQIKELLDHLVTHNVESVNAHAPLKFLELIQILRAARYEDLAMSWDEYRQMSSHRRWLLDAIVVTGTPAALRFIKEKFLANELNFDEESQVLIAAVHMVSANTETIKIMETLTVDKKVLESPVLREIVLLGYGTMIFRNCSELAVCPTEYIKPIQERLDDAVAKRETEKIILLIKVLGNARHPATLKSITKIMPIHGTAAASLPMRVHAEAIMALRNFAKKESRMVQQLALQLYMDKDIHPELRMLSCIVLFETRPSMGLVTTLANNVKTEKNLQVASFTYSHMKSLSRSPSTIQSSVVAACRVAMKIMGPKICVLDRLSLRYSRAAHVDAYNSSLMIGAAVTGFYINDAATILPRSVLAKTRAFLAGAAADVLEIGVRTDGLQEALLKNPEFIDNADRITKMKRVIKALSQWRSMSISKPLASISVKVLGQEIAFANIDKAMIEQAVALASSNRTILEHGKHALKALLLTGVNVQYAKPVLATEVRRIMPTAAGLPMELSLHTAAVAAAVVKIKPKTSPPLPEDFKFGRLLETDIQLETEVRTSFAMNTYAVMGVNTAILQAALVSRARINYTGPAKITARLNIKEGDFKIEVLPVPLPENLTSVNIETFAVARNIEDTAADRITPLIPKKDLPSISSKVISSMIVSSAAVSAETLEDDVCKSNKTKARAFSKRYCVKNVGVGIKACFKVATENAASIRDIALYRMAGRHNLSLSLTPIESQGIERLDMEVKVGLKAVKRFIAQINRSEEILDSAPVLMRLNKILASNRNRSLSSSSSSSSASNRSSKTSSYSSSSSISSSSSNSSNSSTSKRSSSKKHSSSRSSSGSSKTSSASSLASLFIASLSSSLSSSWASKQVISLLKFHKNHRKQGVTSSAASISNSSASSFEAIYRQNELPDSGTAALAVIFRAVRADEKKQGYIVTAYLDKPTARVHMVIASLVRGNNWKLCADGVLLSKHKVTAKMTWGVECKQYDIMATSETGLVGPSPATRLRMSWQTLPSDLKRFGKMMYEYIPAKFLSDLIRAKHPNNTKRISFTIVASSERTIGFIAITPVNTVFNKTVSLPISLPLDEITSYLTPFEDVPDKVHYVFAKALAAECFSINYSLTTFNNRTYENKMVPSCYQVLAQDSTEELKFIVLHNRDSKEQNHINAKIADIDIDLYRMNSEVNVKVNSMEIPLTSLPYQHPKAKIDIRQSGNGVSVYAASHGLHEVYFDKNTWRIKVVDWMKGKTSGLCGKADGEVRQEYRTPNGRLTKNPVSFTHSWILPAESCRDTTECRLKHESVKLEKKINIHGEESTCYSVEPVLRCLPGCFPVKTTSVTVGFNCLPADSTPQSMSSIFESSVDLRENAEAHLACSCTAQCA
ncbi:vitellogenin-1-like [Odontesthes bonariensis]|uniref:vitellogenin-1-like n=1 Tax=Odontesthes bonariensis TaxID=219752 RepID=UPI003F58AF80